MRKETMFTLLACLLALSALSSCGGGGGVTGVPPTVEPTLTWLGILPGGINSDAYGVSSDGSVVVGVTTVAGQQRAFRWTASGMQDLGALPETSSSEARGVSADGSVVVGRALNRVGQPRAFRWTASGMQDLGTLPGGLESAASGVSADGNVVVGVATVAGEPRAFRWRPGEGMRDLNEVFASLLGRGSRLGAARAISRDGRFIVGRGYNATTRRNEAFLLDTARR